MMLMSGQSHVWHPLLSVIMFGHRHVTPIHSTKTKYHNNKNYDMININIFRITDYAQVFDQNSDLPFDLKHLNYNICKVTGN